MTTKRVTSGHKSPTTLAASNPSDFGKNLFNARQRLSWTRPHLASLTTKLVSNGVHENTIYNIEKGKTSGSLEIQRVLKLVISKELKCDYPWEDKDQLLNKKSLVEFITDSDVVSRIDHTIAVSSELKVVPPDSFVGPLFDRNSYLRITTAAELEQLLKDNEQILTAMGKTCYDDPTLRMPFVPRGVSIGLLHVVLLLQKHGLKTLIAFLAKHSLDGKANPQKRAQAIKQAYDLARRSLKRK